MKKGFTIIELMVVVAILAVLLGIITTAATASIRKARERRALAMRETLQNGIAAYRERKDEWPGVLGEWAKNDPPKDRGNPIKLTDGEYDGVVQDVLKISVGKQNRVMDPMGLLVMRAGENNGSSGGRDYREVSKKNGKYGKRMSSKDMTIVYPNANDGKAYRYVIEYNTLTEAVTVRTR